MLNILIIIAMVGCLRLEGRRFSCACGKRKLWIAKVKSSCCSQHLTDPFSFTHLIHGFGFYLVALFMGIPTRDRLAAVVAGEAVFEVIENTSWSIQRFRRHTVSIGYEGDSNLNSVGDTLCCLAGAWLASVLPVAATIAVALVIELGLLATIRDNLTINVLMLVWPIEAVKRWQNS